MGWKVTSQMQTVSRTGPGQSSIDVVRIYFTTDDGFSGYVDVPVGTYASANGPSEVRDMINAAVAQHDQVANLTSE